MNVLIPVLIFIFGLVVGSFLNVVIYRMRELDTILNTRSHCPECKKEIRWYDLIPFLSFILLKTRCRYCAKPISWQYPLVELATGAIFVALFYLYGFSWDMLFYVIISMFLIVIFVYDLIHSIIPDEMLWPAVIISLLYLAFGGGLGVFKMALMGVAIAVGFLGIIYVLGKGKWMGMGDVKLAVLLGLITPFPYVLLTLFSAFIVGSIIGIILMLTGKKTMKSEIPFGPFLIIGVYISLFFGTEIINWYLGMMR